MANICTHLCTYFAEWTKFSNQPHIVARTGTLDIDLRHNKTTELPSLPIKREISCFYWILLYSSRSPAITIISDQKLAMNLYQCAAIGNGFH